ncbi:hypothetical protein LZ32DRAFT_618328 [Colletotrichum eremochloae]|nr:hypothetical protein LZ32DRAFT_618328 [Colletotrichum eremochloae]
MDHRNITSEYESFVARRLGILGVLLETALQTTLWGNKACLLLFYNRLSLLGIEHKFSVVISIFLGLSYVAIIVALYYGWCRPFSEYLVLHPQNDLVLVLIPVARISMLQMKIGKKLILIALFSMGIFVILSAILLKVAVFSATADLIEPVWIIWGIREVSMAILVGNLVLCVPVMKKAWGFFSIRIAGLKKRITLAERRPSTAVLEPRHSERCSIAGQQQIREAHGRMSDVDLEQQDGAEATNRRLSINREDVIVAAHVCYVHPTTEACEKPRATIQALWRLRRVFICKANIRSARYSDAIIHRPKGVWVP